MRVEIRPDADAACAAAGDFVADRVREAMEERGVVTVALSGGTTPRRMFEELAKRELPWPAVHLFQVDERVVPDGHRDRNATALLEHLVAHVALPPGNFHAMPVGTPSLLDPAQRYERLLHRVCGAPAVLDVVHLGLGADGHTASLVPGDAVFEVEDDDVALTSEYEGRVRLTLTFPALRRARHVVWLVTGAPKAEALRALSRGTGLAAARLARHDAVVFADAAAGRPS